MSATVIEELVTLLGFELDKSEVATAVKTYTDLHNLALDLLHVAEKVADALIEPIKNVVRVGTEALRTSKALGTSVQAIQELQIASELSGVSTEELTHALAHLNRASYEATTGHKEQAQAFARMGIALRDTTGHAKTADVLFAEMVDKLGKIPDAGKRTALAFTVMGRGAVALLPLLSGGSRRLNELRDAARNSGAILSDTEAVAARALGFSVKILSLDVEGLNRRLGSGLVPVAQRVIDTITRWFRVTRELINQRLQQAIDFIARATVRFVQALIVVWRTVDTVVQAFGGWKTILEGIGILLGLNLLATVGRFAMAMTDAGEGVFALTKSMILGTIVPALWGVALLAVAAVVLLVIQDLQSADSIIQKFIKEGFQPDDTPLIVFLKSAINLVRGLKTGITDLVDEIKRVHLFSPNDSPIKDLYEPFIPKAFNRFRNSRLERGSGAGALPPLDAPPDFNDPNAGAIQVLRHQVNSTGTAINGRRESFEIHVNQTFNGDADPQKVKTVTTQGVGQALKDADEARRLETFNSGAQAGYQ